MKPNKEDFAPVYSRRPPAGGKSGLLLDQLTKEELLELLRRERFNFAGNDPKAGLLVMPTSSMYYPRGYFSPDEMFEQWQRLYEASRRKATRDSGSPGKQVGLKPAYQGRNALWNTKSSLIQP